MPPLERYRYADRGDLPAFVEMLGDPEVGRWLWFTPAPPELFEGFFGPLLDAQRDALDEGRLPEAAVFVVEDLEGRFLGQGAVVPEDGSPLGFDIGFQLARHAWRRGVGTRLSWFLAAYAVRCRGAHRISGNCLEGNMGSRRLLTALGLRQEGARVGLRLKGDTRHTELLFGAEVAQLDGARLAAIADALPLSIDGACRPDATWLCRG